MPLVERISYSPGCLHGVEALGPRNLSQTKSEHEHEIRFGMDVLRQILVYEAILLGVKVASTVLLELMPEPDKSLKIWLRSKTSKSF